ncbi:MAG: hypothetical protein Q8O40_06780, partial [Chloroflexota bacterium]|nr:hypothetical protein [Chloroflexota bacterium]
MQVRNEELPQHLRRSGVNVPSDWERAVVPGWESQPAFALRLPRGWDVNELQGIDSYVGEIVGAGVRLVFDYGAYSWTLNPAEEDPEHEYIVAYEEIGGVEAKLVVPKDSPDGFTGVYFRRLGGPSLVLYGRGLTAEQQETVFAIFRSIRTLASGYLEVEVSGLDAGDTAVLRLERREPDGSTLRVRRVERLGNRVWQEPTHLSDGQYSLAVEAPGYVNSPVAFDFRVPPRGATWRYDFTFRLFHPDDAESVLGLRLCEPSKTPTGPTPTPQPPPVGGVPAGSCAALPTAMSTAPSIQGVVSSPDGFEGVVRVFELPPAEGECYAQMMACPQLPDARTVDELPDVTEGQLRLELPVDSGVWGYLGPDLPAGKRYLVVLQAPGYVVQPAGYFVPLAAGKSPHIVTNLDFSAQGPYSIPTPTPTPTPPEPAVREAIQRLTTPGGISEVVPGFGGYFLDPQDNSIVYVYMLDPTQQALAEEAARILLGSR